MSNWTQHYTRGAFIGFDFTAGLPCQDQVRAICQQHGWEYVELPGNLELLQNWLDGRWSTEEILVVEPGQQVRPSHDPMIIGIAPPGERPKS
jgi:hypothetical protein